MPIHHTPHQTTSSSCGNEPPENAIGSAFTSQPEGEPPGSAPAAQVARGHITTHFALPSDVAEWLHSLVEDQPEELQRIFCHLVASGTTHAYEGHYVPLYWQLLRQVMGASYGRDPLRPLIDAGLVDEPLPYDQQLGRSRAFRVTAWVWEEMERRMASATEYDEHGRRRYVNLMDGRSARRRRTRLTDASGNPVALPGSALTVGLTVYRDSPALVNLDAARGAVDLRKRRKEAAGALLRRVEERGGAAQAETLGHARRLYNRETGAYYNDYWCLQSVERQRPEAAPDVAPHLWRVYQAYMPQGSGRVHIEGGGTQSLSRPAKRALWEGVPGAKNYDLVSSQLRGLIQRFEEAAEDGYALSADWLRAYDQTPQAKRLYAERAGVSVDAWKRMLYATIMGCHHPAQMLPVADAERAAAGASLFLEQSTVRRILIEEGYGSDLPGAYARVRQVMADLIGERDRWHAYLIGDYASRNARPRRSGPTLYNETGATFVLPDGVGEMSASARKQLSRKLAAFLLQGLEAAFIHRLAALGGQHGYAVLANEHDGLVVRGAIPEEAVREAARQSGLRYAELAEKPFEEIEPLKEPHADPAFENARARAGLSAAPARPMMDDHEHLGEMIMQQMFATAYHEAGHLMASEVLCLDRIDGVCITPHVDKTGGFVMGYVRGGGSILSPAEAWPAGFEALFRARLDRELTAAAAGIAAERVYSREAPDECAADDRKVAALRYRMVYPVASDDEIEEAWQAALERAETFFSKPAVLRCLKWVAIELVDLAAEGDPDENGAVMIEGEVLYDLQERIREELSDELVPPCRGDIAPDAGGTGTA